MWSETRGGELTERVYDVECTAYTVECGVWSVKCRVRIVKCRVQGVEGKPEKGGRKPAPSRSLGGCKRGGMVQT